MAVNDKVVLRFNSGELIKGYLREFSLDSQAVLFEELGRNSVRNIPVHELKAIFFVKTFEGDSKHREKKRYGLRQKVGKKIFIRFKDGESMIGYLQGDVHWDKGFFISKPDEKKTGFSLVPVDEDSNNLRVFVVGASIKDITVIP